MTALSTASKGIPPLLKEETMAGMGITSTPAALGAFSSVCSCFYKQNYINPKTINCIYELSSDLGEQLLTVVSHQQILRTVCQGASAVGSV